MLSVEKNFENNCSAPQIRISEADEPFLQSCCAKEAVPSRGQDVALSPRPPAGTRASSTSPARRPFGALLGRKSKQGEEKVKKMHSKVGLSRSCGQADKRRSSAACPRPADRREVRSWCDETFAKLMHGGKQAKKERLKAVNSDCSLAQRCHQMEGDDTSDCLLDLSQHFSHLIDYPAGDDEDWNLNNMATDSENNRRNPASVLCSPPVVSRRRKPVASNSLDASTDRANTKTVCRATQSVPVMTSSDTDSGVPTKPEGTALLLLMNSRMQLSPACVMR